MKISPYIFIFRDNISISITKSSKYLLLCRSPQEKPTVRRAKNLNFKPEGKYNLPALVTTMLIPSFLTSAFKLAVRLALENARQDTLIHHAR
eukprot:scaffold6550_cov225-Skeletonema_marinoi.AAC.2